MKFIRVPTDLLNPPYNNSALFFDGFSVINSCIYTKKTEGTMFFEEHALLFVLNGANILTHGKQTYTVRKNEMILLRKATMYGFTKQGCSDDDNIFHGILFCLKDEFLKEFVKIAGVEKQCVIEQTVTTVKTMNDRLVAFVNSIIPYFAESDNINEGLLKIKMLELLYDIAASDKNLLQQILQLKQPILADIASVIEDNYTNPVSIPELAYLSGKSLSTFKREFQTIYNMPPSKWIKTKRLEQARKLLTNESLSVADACYMSGFENTTHFARIFKEHFGYPPSSTHNSTHK